MEKLDHHLYKELLALPKLPFLRMVRQDRRLLARARKAFFLTGTPPTFFYPKVDGFDVEAYLAQLASVETRIRRSAAPRPLKTLYHKKCAELRLRAKCIQAIQQNDDRATTRYAKKMFGTPKESLRALRAEAAARAHTHGYTHQKRIDATAFARMARLVLDHYGLNDWRIKIVRRSSIQIGGGKRGRTPVIRIPASLMVSAARATRLLVHEIEVHALRAANGTNSPLHLLGHGCAGYIRTDEGLAMYYQDTKAAKVRSVHLSGFWEAYTAALSAKRTFKDTFTELRQHLGQDAAWRLCVRAYRGIRHPDKPGLGFFRDHLYRTGRMDVERAVKRRGEGVLPMLFAGKVGLSDLATLQALHIPAGKLPDLISQKIVHEELMKK